MPNENETNKYVCYNGPIENGDQHGHQKIKIGVSGAAETALCGLNALEIGEELGKQIIKQGGMLITGATTGFPMWASMGAKKERGIVFGFSPASSEKDHIEGYRLPTDYTDLIIYTGFGFPGRDLLFTRACDAVIVGCGRMGTIHEFTVSLEDNKPTGVLIGPWMTDTDLQKLVTDSGIQYDNIVFEEDPQLLVEKLIKLVEKNKAILYKNH